MRTLVKRNIKLFFRDKTNLFFSMLSVLVIVALFGLFFGRVGDWRSGDIRDSWIMSGVLAVAALTTALGAFSTMVEDRVCKIAKGFYASPIKRSHITASYILSPFIISVVMTAVTAIAFAVYIIATGGDVLSITVFLQLVGVILLSSISGTAMVCCIVSFLKSNSSFSTVSIILGSIAPFLMGVYLSMGQFPPAIRAIMMAFPPSHSAMLFRRVLMERAMTSYFVGEQAVYLQGFQESMGATVNFGSFEVTPIMSVVYMIATAILFFGLAAVSMRKIGK